MLRPKILLPVIISWLCGNACIAQLVNYPATRKVAQTDNYFGTKVEDPYRWLEDDKSAETGLWVDMQNETTEKYMVQIPFRKRLKERLTALSNYEKFSPLQKAGNYYFYTRNSGLQNQSVIYYTKSWRDTGTVFFDPNQLSIDGTVSLASYSLSPDGKYMGYGLSTAGSDWMEIHVKETSSGKILDDKIEWAKFSGIAWKDDGFYYSRFDAVKQGNAFTIKNQFHKVYYHKLGSKQQDDVLIYEDKKHAQRNFYAKVTDDGRYLVISGSETTSGNNLVIKDLRKPKDPFITLVDSFKNDFDVFGNIGDSILVLTNWNAPRGRIICVDMSKYVKGEWNEIVPQQAEIMQGATQSFYRIVVKYMKDASNMMVVYLNGGAKFDELRLDSPGTIDAVTGDRNDTVLFYSVSSFISPSTIYRYQVAARFNTIQFASKIDFAAEEYTASQILCKSKDGTPIPMFVVYKSGLDLNSNNPTLLFGYGGFNISKTPEFKPERLLFLENGGIFVMAILRGGGEYGEEWHQAGTKLKKQNVFDDFIAAAEYLEMNGFTNPSRLAISGRSNGGLLVGAVMTQRPDLFKVALPAVGVMDMLRYHKFTIGWSWAGDYGTSDNKDEFNAIYKYSPLHRIAAGVKYPCTFVTTGDHDDRVVPAHSFKFIATLQEKNAGQNPMLIRIDKNAGHGSGKPLSKLIDEQADVFAFTMYNLGMSVK
jgi:prolyl oligopeptidase